MANYNVAIFDSDEDDEDMFNLLPVIRKAKRFQERHNYFEILDDHDFFVRFRLQKNTCMYLLEQIQQQISSNTDRNMALSPITKLLLTLRFLATGSMLIVAGDFAGVSKSSTCGAVKCVTEAIARLRNIYIRLPSNAAERLVMHEKFYRIASFPKVLGAIDCTHVRIQSPGGNDAEHFRNRKGYFSWNVQAVCDADLCIQDIVARWPGASHDQTIFNNSALKAKIDAGEIGDSVLLGDSGYGLTNYLITPILNPRTPVENLFNESQIRTRNCVERAFGVWKRRFPILSLGIRVSLARTQAIIVATAVLHNLAIIAKNGEAPLENPNNLPADEEPDPVNAELQQQNNPLNNIRRLALINNHFANL